MTEITFQALSPAADPTVAQVRTGPSGLILGIGPSGPVTLRMFRQQPTRLFVSVPDYMTWLLAFRAMCLGAHLSVIGEDHRKWLALADTVRASGGTIDLLRSADNLPGQGRPYRPSLIIDAVNAISPTHRLGAWQSVITLGDPEESRAVGDLRGSEVALIAPLSAKAAEYLRRAYALSSGQVRVVTELDETEVVIANVRRLTRVNVAPSPTEHQLLFGR